MGGTDAILVADEKHRAHMERGSKWLRTAIMRARYDRQTPFVPPVDLLWTESPPPVNWVRQEGALNRQEQVYRVGLIEARERRADQLRVSRDPCPMCAVRADIGCSHRRAA